ncbi:hypothetical protein Tsubulata_043517 [Turnera subulata]|uniref:Polygalacturonase n=1 Tax=Turnera subulata TaxID=218843 RepID=A0A9Q0FG37_9ROSI|nr:hypothetical protein Tsubulata_043517 [Turnera subulata]
MWIDGTLVAPEDYRILGQSKSWISFENVTGVSILGGALDTKGSSLWACKAAKGNCPKGATHITLMYLVSMKHLIKLFDCVNLWAPDIELLEFQEHKGEGVEEEEPGVQNVTVRRTVFVCSTNGFRIKSWARDSNGFVRGVRFIGAVMHNMQFPIIIVQDYCPHNLNCPGQVSGVKINDVIYQGIRGTSATEVAVKFHCSSKSRCRGIILQDINLSYMNRASISSCAHVDESVIGEILPSLDVCN